MVHIRSRNVYVNNCYIYVEMVNGHNRMTKRELAVQRLIKANRFLELALDTRAVPYEAIPYVVAASKLTEIAISK